MKKTWTTRILIALMTLAMVVGVVAIAPKAAQAAGFSITPSFSVEVGSSASVTVTPPDSTQYYYAFKLNGTEQVFLPNNYYNVNTSSVGTQVITCDVFTSDARTTQVASNLSCTVTVNAVPVAAGVTATDSTKAGKVGTKSTLTFTVSGEPKPTNVQISVSGADSWDYTGNTVSAYVTPTSTSDTRTVTVSANNGTGSTASATTQVTPVNKADAVTITLTASEANPAVGEPVTLTVGGVPNGAGGTYTWTKDGASIANTGKTYVYTPTATGAATFAVQWQGDANYPPSANAPTATVTTGSARVSVSVTSPSNNANVTVGSTLVLACSNNNNVSGVSYQWTASNGGTILNNTQQSASYTVQPADINQSITFTVTASATGSTTGTSSSTVRVVGDDYISGPSSNYTMSFNTATLYDVQSFTVSTYRGGLAKIYNTNPKVASVTAGGQIVDTNGVTIANGTQVSVKALEYGRTYIDIVPVNGQSNNGRRITVYVGSQTPTLDVQFWSCDYCTTTLTKVNNWGTLKVTVDNYNPAYPYVTITRSNIRTYIQGGSYYSHPSTYTYTAALTQDLTDPLKATATLYVIPQYNGTTYYTAAYTGAVSKNSPTIYVTGYTTLPQTGPNYTWAYVLGGLCLATAATAVTLNVRKKKRESI